MVNKQIREGNSHSVRQTGHIVYRHISFPSLH